MLDDQEFKTHCDSRFDALYRALVAASEDFDFEVDMNGGALTVEFEKQKTRFVVSPNSPVKQIWLSANVKSFKFDWDEVEQGFILPATGQTLAEVLGEQISKVVGEPVTL